MSQWIFTVPHAQKVDTSNDTYLTETMHKIHAIKILRIVDNSVTLLHAKKLVEANFPLDINTDKFTQFLKAYRENKLTGPLFPTHES